MDFIKWNGKEMIDLQRKYNSLFKFQENKENMEQVLFSSI